MADHDQGTDYPDAGGSDTNAYKGRTHKGTVVNDVFYGTSGSDFFIGNSGADKFFGGGGFDIFDGGSDTDTVSYYFATSGIQLYLSHMGDNRGDAAGSSFASIEVVDGSTMPTSWKATGLPTPSGATTATIC